MRTRDLAKSALYQEGQARPCAPVHRLRPQTDGPRTSARGVLGVAIQTLARRLLSGGPAANTMVRALRANVRHGGDQQHLLPSARTRDVRRLGAARAAGVRVRREGEPVPDAHEEAEGSGRTNRSPVHAYARARHASRT